jgi:hypothetical protein
MNRLCHVGHNRLQKNGTAKPGSQKKRGIKHLPSLDQYDVKPGRMCCRFSYRMKCRGSEAIDQRHARANTRDIDQANVQVHPVRAEDVNAAAVIGSMKLGAPPPQY